MDICAWECLRSFSGVPKLFSSLLSRIKTKVYKFNSLMEVKNDATQQRSDIFFRVSKEYKILFPRNIFFILLVLFFPRYLSFIAPNSSSDGEESGFRRGNERGDIERVSINLLISSEWCTELLYEELPSFCPHFSLSLTKFDRN